jgi:hypothetical protein
VRASADDTSAPPSDPPPFKQLRYDENYAYLSDHALRTDFLDAIKFIPLSKSGESYLTLGGEIRERYEYYHNSQWGLGPQDDNGYLLQCYMIHADTHLGEWFRVFGQLKSGLEDGRNGGPRPPDEDKFDLHQAFFEVRVPFAEAASFTLSCGPAGTRLRFFSTCLISRRPERSTEFRWREGNLEVCGLASRRLCGEASQHEAWRV